jgi:hypothetical protein
MLPREQIQTELGFADAYLIEARSIGGISGSPAFIRQTVQLPIHMSDIGEVAMQGLGGSFCLGLMHGHWDIKESEMNATHPVHDPMRGVNMGIGIVVPAIKIIETINRPELAAKRQLWDDSFPKRYSPSMD